ncbi:alk-exo [Sucra jujuba nucleopolyhedrovirus]|uniref:Alk-exo n=1 Tax=Sucra jujuba nucleopolyhedrovirus TaxID=1563660 RepID=A0A097P979_9ABAC|nr:alk-exo [Sucra jujuba nucleopolyhedrovirus]AIU41364.1 alk-exo [Sucra jujuba nucleopolyhedrovirus]
MGALTCEQQRICDKFLYSNFVNNLTDYDQRLTHDEILEVERMTRGQHENALWKTLRLDRQTASGSSNNSCISETAAMSFGIAQEKSVKNDCKLFDSIRRRVEMHLKRSVKDTVLECGMFFSEYGLCAASPDAYFVMDDDSLVPVEIKCPISYKDISVEQMRNSLNTRKSRYRVKHTALSVNKTGVPVFTVEQTDPHYRQMQRQMYVLNAPVCVYVVKFSDTCVVCVVDRNWTFSNTERVNEKKMFDMYVRRRKNLKLYLNVEQRKISFRSQNHWYGEQELHRLVSNGFFYVFGEIQCVHCGKKFNTDTPVTRVLELHCCTLPEPLIFDKTTGQPTSPDDNFISAKDVNVIHVDYYDHSERTKSLHRCKTDWNFANEGVFYCDKRQLFLTFCCNQIVNDLCNIVHETNCKFPLLMMQITK